MCFVQIPSSQDISVFHMFFNLTVEYKIQIFPETTLMLDWWWYWITGWGKQYSGSSIISYFKRTVAQYMQQQVSVLINMRPPYIGKKLIVYPFNSI